VEADGSAWTEVGTIVTNGPFRLQAWTHGESLVLARYPAYHGRFIGNLRRVELSLLGDPPTHLEKYEADRLDILALARLPPAESIRAWQRHAGECISAPALITWYVGLNVSRSPFDDPRVRRAFVRAIDMEALAGVALGSGFYPSTGGFVPPGMPGHSEGIGLPHDPERARQLLSEAGYPGGRGLPVLELLMVHTRGPVGEFLQAEWGENLGVEIRCVNVGLAEMYDRLANDAPPIFSLAWRAEYPDPDNFLRVAPIRRYTRWHNQAYDRLLGQATRCMDQTERMRLYGKADRLLIDEAVIMPYAYGRFDLLVKPWVRGLPTSATRYWFWKDVILEPH
jgi:ABC-type oligopeptide transport system substrate-binding subunit